ncbi:MAG TPA: protein translocase subunit SecF [Thermomicrobiales bacterium]
MEHLASRRKIWYAISLIVMIPGLISLALYGLNLGIDFTGGTNWVLKFNQSLQTEEVRAVLEDHGFDNSTVQLSSEDGRDNVAIINMKELQTGSPEKRELEAAFRERFGDFVELEIVSVGASVGNEISRRAVIAVSLASLGILAYIAFAFRNTQNPVLYGLCAVAAMLHDVLVVVGIFSILGKFANVEIDALFVTALLTVIGFSVHDTIVVFDRIRENLARKVASSFEEVVNYSLAQTLVRSLNTSVTVVFTLLALYLFGGESTKNFVLALLIGVISGTYSSIFNASQLLVSWENGEIQRLFRRLTGRGSDPALAPTR